MKRLAILINIVALSVFGFAAPALAVVPTNDTYGGREAVSIGFSATVDTSDATTDADDAEANGGCGAPATDASVWYELTATSDGVIVVDVSASNYSAGALVATGSPGNFSVVACGPGATAFEAFTGETYAILAFDDQFDGGGNGGMLEITIGEAPPPPEVTMTVNRSGRFNSTTGSATISGTVTCTGGPVGFSFIEAFVRQTVGRFYVSGFGFIEGFSCDGTTQPWSVEVFGDSGKFKGGKAVSVTFAVACGDFFCGFDFKEHVVQLKGGR